MRGVRRPIVTTADAALRDDLAAANGAVAFLRAKVARLDEVTMVWGTEKRMIHGTGADGRQEVVLRSGVSVWMQILEWWSAHRAEVAAQVMVRLDIDRRWVDTQAMFGERLADALDPSSRTARPACGGGHP